MSDVPLTSSRRVCGLALGLLLAGVLTGCSDEGAGPEPRPSLAPSAAAAQSVLVLADLGEGWKEEAAAGSSVAETLYDAQVAQCEKRTYVQPRAQEIGKLLTRTDGSAQVSSRARVHASEQLASEEIASRTSEIGLTCAEKQARASARERLAGGKIEKLVFRPAAAPEGVDVRVVSEITAVGDSGVRAMGYVEVLEVRRGALVASATITSFNQPVSPELLAQVGAALVERVE